MSTDNSSPQNDLNEEAQQDFIQRISGVMRRLRYPHGADNFRSQLLSDIEELCAPSPLSAEKQSRQEVQKQALKQKLDRIFLGVEKLKVPCPTDLNRAVIDGDLARVRQLLDESRESNTEKSTENLSGFLRMALLFGHQEIAALLSERGANYGIPEAALAGDLDTLRNLLDRKSDISQWEQTINRALQLATRNGHTETVRLLLEQGANPNTSDQLGNTPLIVACSSGFPEIAYLLVEADLTMGIVEAAYLGDIALLKRFLDEGVDIETRNVNEITPLTAAAICGHNECVRFLLERGANPHAENSRGTRAIFSAIAHEHVPVIHLLIDYGVDVDSSDFQSGWSLLETAVSFSKIRSVEALLTRGANPNATSGSGRSPLHLCAYFASMTSDRKKHAPPRIASLLLDAGARIEARDNAQYTPLMAATSDGDAEMVRLLLERGADVGASTPDGNNDSLSCVRRYRLAGGEKTQARTFIMEAMGPEYAVYDAAERGGQEQLRKLLDSGAPADQNIVFEPRLLKSGYFSVEDLGETPLAAAAGKGHLAIVKQLLARADISVNSRNNALFAAEWENQTEVARILRETGAVDETADRLAQDRTNKIIERVIL